MAALQWIGGGDSLASNINDWDIGRDPLAGDTLGIFADAVHPGPFTMNVRGNDLAGDSIRFGGPGLLSDNLPIDFMMNLSHHAIVSATSFFASGQHTFNLSQHSNLTLQANRAFAAVNVTGTDTATLGADGGGIDVHLLSGAHLHGTLNMAFGGFLTMTGAAGSEIDNDGPSIMAGPTAKIGADVGGHGSFDVRGQVEFAQSVGSRQTVHADNGGHVQIDHPDQFHATVSLDRTPPPPGSFGIANTDTIDLMGLATADSYSYRNDMLKIYAGDHVIERLHLDDNTLYGFVVEAPVGSKVSIVEVLDLTHRPVGLPVHV
jgi:hypothetical protein